MNTIEKILGFVGLTFSSNLKRKNEQIDRLLAELNEKNDELIRKHDEMVKISDGIEKLHRSTDRIIGIADTNTWYLTHVNRNVCNIFQYMTGIELNKNLVMEREIVFDPKNAPIDHFNRYSFAVDNIKSSDRVLDVACACGYGSSMLAKKAKTVLGVDIFKPVVDFAQKIFGKDNLNFICQDAQSLQLHDSFDVVVSFETIEHIPEPQEFLKKANALLTKDGKLICSVPNEETRPYSKEGNSFHYRHYTKDQFKEFLKDCGFEVVELYQQYSDNNYSVEKRSENGQIIVVIAKKVI